jgi:hypothetical protein
MGTTQLDRATIAATSRTASRVAAFALLAALWGCGGGGAPGDPPPDGNAGGTTGAAGAEGGGELSIVLDAPQRVPPGSDIRLTWQAAGASAFTVFVQAATGQPFEAVSATVAPGTAQFARGAAWKLDFPSARVRVRACDATQNCVDSNEQPLEEALLAGIARVSPDETAFNAVFASNIALSADGHTLAGAAPTDRIIGTPGFPGSGSVFAFQRSSDGAWAQRARLERFSVANNFGDPMALSGDGRTLAVGAYSDSGTVGGINPPEVGSVLDPQGNVDWRGAVYVYTREDQQPWTRQAFIKALVPLRMDQFGSRIAFSHDGNRMLVGSVTRMYLFAREGGQWRQERTFESPPGISYNPAGAMALSANGTTIAVGAAGRVPSGPVSIPYTAVHVYKPCPCGDGWRRVADLRSAKPPTSPRVQDPDGFPTRLALSGDGNTLAVGAPFDPGDASDTGTGPNNGAREAGAVYVFGPDADGVWQRRAFLKARGAPAYDQLGADVALSGDGKVLAVKACGFAANADGLRRNHRAGATIGRQEGDVSCFWGGSGYVFEPDADGVWRHTAAAIAVPGQLVSFAFFSLALSADARTLGLGTMVYSADQTSRGAVVLY